MKWIDHTTAMLTCSACATVLVRGDFDWADASASIILTGLAMYHLVKMWRA